MNAVIKNVKFLVLAMAMLVSVGAEAAGSCVITLKHICPISPTTRPNVGFTDNAYGAGIDAGRCLQRAQEYKSWCNQKVTNRALEVVAIYYVGNLGVIASTTASDGLLYILHGSVNRYSYAGFSN